MTAINLKPSIIANYPPFKNGLYMEEYFSKYWEQLDNTIKTRFIYIDAFWHNIFHLNIFGSNGSIRQTMNELTPYILEICNNAKKENKIVFTLCHWDDGIQLQCEKPDNLIIFSIGGSNNLKDKAVNLPLIVEDKTNRLLSYPRKSFKDRRILCSFIGTFTHHVRNILYDSLKHNGDFQFECNNSWSINVSEHMMNLFIDVTSNSKFGLAPRGYGNSSFRFFEIMQLGVIPIYVYDTDNINGLPYQDILDYSLFSIVICINKINELPSILHSISEDKYNQMLIELNKVKHYFAPDGVCDYVIKYLDNI